MDETPIDHRWPNALRWFLAQGLRRFAPWHLLAEADALRFAAEAFRREDVAHGEVFVFARRQDRDDFAAIAIVDGAFTDTVICFHPAFTRGGGDPRGVVSETFADVFDFMARRVMPDMREWARDEDAADLCPRPGGRRMKSLELYLGAPEFDRLDGVLLVSCILLRPDGTLRLRTLPSAPPATLVARLQDDDGATWSATLTQPLDRPTELVFERRLRGPETLRLCLVPGPGHLDVIDPAQDEWGGFSGRYARVRPDPA